MNCKIRKLLDKKKITGHEFGRAYIITRLRDRLTEGRELILTDEEIKILGTKLIEQSEFDKANAYVEFYSWIDRAYLIARGNYHNLYVGLSGLYFKLGSTVKSEQGFNNLKKLAEGGSKREDSYQQLKALTESILMDMSIFHQVEEPEGSEYMQITRDTVMNGVPSLLTYNKSVCLFADFFKIPEISKAFEINTDRLFAGINLINDKIVLLKTILSGTEDKVRLKLEILDNFCPMINVKELEPSEAAVRKALKSLKSCILNSKPAQIIGILSLFEKE